MSTVGTTVEIDAGPMTAETTREGSIVSDEPPGGLGGGSGRGIRDTRLVARAVAERWPIPRALRGPLIERLATIAMDPEASPREVAAAARAILGASKINLEAVAATIKAHEHAELSARVAELEAR